MSKLLISAGAAVLDFFSTVPASTTDKKGFSFPRSSHYLPSRKSAGLKAEPTTGAASPVGNEKDEEPGEHQSSLYRLAAANPHVLATSLFSRKFR